MKSLNEEAQDSMKLPKSVATVGEVLSKNSATVVSVGLFLGLGGVAIATHSVHGAAALERTLLSGVGSISMLGAGIFLQVDKRLRTKNILLK